jgi:hypothetical protein
VPAHKVSRVLRRRGVAYLRSCDPMTGGLIRASKTTELRYERDHPGELVHIDVKRLGRIPEGRWRAHGAGVWWCRIEPWIVTPQLNWTFVGGRPWFRWPIANPARRCRSTSAG